MIKIDKNADYATPPPIGSDCRVHFNLRTGMWSIRIKTPKGWRVVFHAEALVLRDCTPVVSAAGVARIISLKRRNVVACIAGTLEALTYTLPAGAAGSGRAEYLYIGGYRRIRFNPYTAPHFVKDTRGGTWSKWTGGTRVAFLPTPPGATGPRGALAYQTEP